MTFSVFLSIAFMVIATIADPCLDNQHCSDCDNTTGHCLTECDAGYFDLKCFSVCDGHCKGNLCFQSADGSGRCAEGCEPGYQGQSCNIPCDSPGGKCTACPGGCDGGYCQLDTSCVSGCVDSYFGTGCNKPCDSPGGNCTACPGGCDGGYCQLGSSCVSGCVDSYYGSGCYNTCSTNCGRNPFTLEDESSVMIQSDCHRKSGDCIFGCKHGWHGPRCSSQYDRSIKTIMTVGLPTTAMFVIILAVCCRFCKCRCCRRSSQAEPVWDNSEISRDSEWSLEADLCHSQSDQEQHRNLGAGCEMYDVVYSSPEEGPVSDRGDLHGGYSSIEDGLVSDRRDIAYSSPVYTGESVVRYINPVQSRR